MGAVPKKKLSKARRDRRRAHDFLQPFHLVPCPTCGDMKRSHRVCLNCGNYNGHQVLPDTRE